MKKQPVFKMKAMNPFRFWAAAAAVMFLGSCTAEKQPLDQEAEPQVVLKDLVLSAYSSDGSATKSSRDDDGTFYWSTGDEISLFHGTGSQGGARFTYSGPRAEVADFSGTMEESEGEYWGIYPYNALNAYDGEKLITEVPSRQVAAEGTFADGQFISIGHSDNLSMGFYHLCGGVKFFLNVSGVTRITLQDNDGKALAGVVEVKIDNEDHPYVSNVVEPRYEIVLSPPSGQTTFKGDGTNYFFVTMPATFEHGFNVILEQGDTQVGARLTSGGMTVNRARFQWSNNPIETGAGSFSTLSRPETENDKVKTFLADAGYNNSLDYTNSYFDNYTVSTAYDTPKAVELTWSASGGKSIQIASSPSFSTGSLFPAENITFSSSNKKATVYNLVPDVVYYYRVLSSSNSVVAQGSIRPVGPVRMIKGLSKNFRDLGGWQAGDKKLRYGRLYRGYNINGLSSDGQAILKNTLGVGKVLDLRGFKTSEANDIKNAKTLVKETMELQWENYPVEKLLGVATNNPGNTAELYRAAIKDIITFLRDDGRAVFFHCAGGADRTGTLALLIEALIGVPFSDICLDYELTTFDKTHRRLRNSTDLDNYPFKTMIEYLRTYHQTETGRAGSTIQEIVTTWATTGTNALTLQDIEQLKALLLE